MDFGSADATRPAVVPRLDLRHVAAPDVLVRPEQTSPVVSRSQRDALNRYTRLGYGNTNAVLRGAVEGAETRSEVLRMDAALERLQQTDLRYRKPVYRAVDDHAQIPWEHLVRGAEFYDAGYVSATHASDARTREFLHRFIGAGVLLKIFGRSGIRLDTGTRHTDGQPLSISPEEGEVLFPRGTRFHVLANVPIDAEARQAAWLLELRRRPRPPRLGADTDRAVERRHLIASNACRLVVLKELSPRDTRDHGALPPRPSTAPVGLTYRRRQQNAG